MPLVMSWKEQVFLMFCILSVHCCLSFEKNKVCEWEQCRMYYRGEGGVKQMPDVVYDWSTVPLCLQHIDIRHLTPSFYNKKPSFLSGVVPAALCTSISASQIWIDCYLHPLWFKPVSHLGLVEVDFRIQSPLQSPLGSRSEGAPPWYL